MTPDEPSASDESGPTDDTETGSGGGDLLEAAIMIASALLIAGLLGYTVSQAIVTPTAAEPTAGIESVEPFPAENADAERLRVTVSLDNEGETGLSSVEVVVQCGRVERSLLFTHVPARGHTTGTVVCPQGTTPTASVASWIEA